MKKNFLIVLTLIAGLLATYAVFRLELIIVPNLFPGMLQNHETELTVLTLIFTSLLVPLGLTSLVVSRIDVDRTISNASMIN